ncbi:MAG TPA: TadE/TadG family type IV pilus assembly protein [Vicinamibacterales bacterium]|nr:TadE/TadG family type IV pilus assembly protein [Vicinamibacterales bacterium]
MTLKQAHRNEEAGGALVELALVLPVLVLVFVGTVDFGRVFYTSQSLVNAARAGVQYGAHTPARSADLAGMKTTAEAATGMTGITATASRLCQCASDSGTFSPTAGTANDCTTPETTSCPGGHRVVTVTVVTTKSFSTLMAGGLPAFMQTMSLTRTATMRAQ